MVQDLFIFVSKFRGTLKVVIVFRPPRFLEQGANLLLIIPFCFFVECRFASAYQSSADKFQAMKLFFRRSQQAREVVGAA